MGQPYDHWHLAHEAAQACVEAGDYLRERFRDGVQARTKHGVAPPTAHVQAIISECDLHAEAMIRKRLDRVAPGSCVVGEEGGAFGESDLCWYVDPLDGTYNFVRELPIFCVSIGFTVDGVPRGGCVYDPVHRELFVAADNQLLLNGERFDSPAVTGERPPLVLTDIPHGSRPHVDEQNLLLELSRHAEVRRLGSSALALAWLAVGRAEVAANTDIYLWDVAAGRCLVEAAGGRFVMAPDPHGTPWRGTFVAWTAAGETAGTRLLDVIACRS